MDPSTRKERKQPFRILILWFSVVFYLFDLMDAMTQQIETFIQTHLYKRKRNRVKIETKHTVLSVKFDWIHCNRYILNMFFYRKNEG